jgi:hypothetical protein
VTRRSYICPECGTPIFGDPSATEEKVARKPDACSLCGTPKTLPTLEEARAAQREARRLQVETAKRAKPWPATRDSEETLRLRGKWPDGQRLTTAWALALDVDACADLLAGRAVAPERIDQGELFNARRKRLIQLVAPIDLLETLE